MKKNEKGSTLAWAITIIMILMVTISAALAISYSYYNRSIITNSKRQAYVSAKNVIVNIVDNLLKGNNEKYLALIPDGEKETSRTLQIKQYPAEMGIIKEATISRTKEVIEDKKRDVLTISIAVNFADQLSIVNADMIRIASNNTWQLLRYYEGDATLNKNIANANIVASHMKTLNDAYLADKNAIKAYVRSDVKGMEIMNAKYPNWSTTFYYNNDVIRQYFYYAKYGGSWITFDNKITNIPDKLGNKQYYIQPYFVHNKYETCIVYATTNNTASPDWNNVRLIFSDGHWYYLETPITMTMFNDNANMSSSEIWKKFKAERLSATNRID